MNTEQERPCPKSWGDGYRAGYEAGLHAAADTAQAYANAIVKQALEALQEAEDKILKLKTKEN